MAARAERRDEALAVDYRPVEALVPYARNARTHSEAQVAQIAGSIREYGFTNPVLVDGANGIIAGHGRVMAARQLGMTTVPVIELAHLTEAQKRAYILADNRLAEQAGWDRELLALEVADLSDLGVDLGSLGFEMAEIDALLHDGAPDPREEDTPEPPEVPVSRPGDLWQLGRHRLICGDATDRATVERLLGDLRPHLMVTDPPYGVNYDPGWRNAALAAKTKRTGKVANDDRADWREAWALFPGDVAYVWHGALHATTVAESLVAEGFGIRAQIVWAKDRLVLGRGHYHWQHEPCWYAVRGKEVATWYGPTPCSHPEPALAESRGSRTKGTVPEPVPRPTPESPVELPCARPILKQTPAPGQAGFLRSPSPALGPTNAESAAETTRNGPARRSSSTPALSMCGGRRWGGPLHRRERPCGGCGRRILRGWAVDPKSGRWRWMGPPRKAARC